MSDQSIEIRQSSWEELAALASDIRRRVFIEEQDVPQQEEWDGRDPACLHFLAWRDGHAIGTARLLPDGHIGRVAVLEEGRGRGIGLLLMREAIEAARRRGDREVVLDAQVHALAFYRKLGFEAFGDEFLDAGIPHRSMRFSLRGE
ncbi:Predicted N-acyltransferase, GNAT family [Modicisalibacter ilicicola DSM 19980]|uniref:Predicted N-acyltransferase, GNAT family n=1 Tax=Modicisalibacter ilicicola DSM 19980 TaxID=1121942 RepID=A0A1M4Y8K4_9GAMM|nr:GNAT family N-acetyltransferase [Halomonas ilicicola]SHF02157.1 Predicted N-acyltransferase, GNAT family [Halomonas ilicicola DSM 19980]